MRMKPKANGAARGQKGNNSIQSQGPNWIVIAGGALLSMLSSHLLCRLKKALDSKRQTDIKGHLKSSDRRRSSGHRPNSNLSTFTQDDYSCFNYISGNEGLTGTNHPQSDQLLSESEVALPLVVVPGPDFAKDNRVMWVASPDQIELPPKPFHHFHHSNGSDSPCVSEYGSDIFGKREVIQKLRQQLKRRDDMIMEMQDQIVELQDSLNAQLSLATSVQSQLDIANKDLFDSKREIQRLRKAIADHCVNHIDTNDKPPKSTTQTSVSMNGPTNGYAKAESNYESGQRIDMLKREVGELKELIEGKEYLLQNYKEQKAELSIKIKELQERLDSQVPTIL